MSSPGLVPDLQLLLLAGNLLENSELSGKNPGLGMWRSGPCSKRAVEDPEDSSAGS